ncbi:alpha/beta hydrolase [Occultella glacieicola]|uniref:Alpha/beta hydrolase n=1 Tax=Occultella glacieicola TaxID=2518684 RepID=A0ABY2E5B9_9MICO|nr:alpha/beta hydrolase [Occultella glacieicola]TDE92617.1 alpha/beta hydrolase [Occultella glacieicola]
MALSWRVRILGAVLRVVVGRYATMPDAKRRLLQAHDGPSWIGDLLNGPPDPTVRIADIAVPGPAGDIPARMFQPGDERHDVTKPLVVVFPGGGFVFAHQTLLNWLSSRLCARLGAVVVSPGYRLAPAHPAPAAGEDCYAVTAWLAANAERFGGDAGRLAVIGESAGANLAAVVTLMARDSGGPAIRAQGLLQGAFDVRPRSPLMTTRSTEPFGRPTDAPDMVRAYLGEHGDPADPLISPLLASDHSGLPPAFVLTADHDYLYEDGIRYGETLRAAGVRVELARLVDSPHGIFSFPTWCAASGPALDRLAAFLRRELAPDG